MHVFTSKVIVPDLYDRPLTLRVHVHQHQAENTQGYVRAGPNLALCHSLAVTSNWNALQQITFIPALLRTQGGHTRNCTAAIAHPKNKLLPYEQ